MILEFRKSIDDSSQLRSLHDHCENHLSLPGDYSDLLRMSSVYCMSALDKLVHDIVIHEMVEIFAGRRQPTPKYLSETISLENFNNLTDPSTPAEIIFEGAIRRKLSHLSFLDPNKLVDALSLIWFENHKWQVISDKLAIDKNAVTTELRNIYKRRNAIVHESDKDPVSNQKMIMQSSDSERVEFFILNLGEAIHSLTT